MATFPKPPGKAVGRKVTAGKRAAAKPLPTRRNAAPGQMKKAAGVQSARQFTPAATAAPKPQGIDVGAAIGGFFDQVRKTVSGTNSSPTSTAMRNAPIARRKLGGK